MELFTKSGLDSNIIQAIEELGFKEPTPIQEATIPVLLNGNKDLVALAQTGTGKTAAFALPLIQLIDTNARHIQALILCPTRELCLQICKDITKYSKYTKGLRSLAIYGGSPIGAQIRELEKSVHVVVATPGRAKDLLNRGILKLNKLQWVVLDEADEMLNMGFKDDLDQILSHTPESRQSLLFSATMSKEVERIARSYMTDPDKIKLGAQNSGSQQIEHQYFMVQARDRYAALKRIADANPLIYSIVFCRTRQETRDVAEKLMNDGYNADALHGDLSQAQRDAVMDKFRRKSIQMLVATDVAARGIDVSELTHVINYNLPDELEAYVHRSGRTGRAGRKGISIAIVHSREGRKIRDLEKLANIKFEHKTVPTGSEICYQQLMGLIEKVQQVEVQHDEIEKFLPAVYEKFEDLSRDELIQRFISVEFNRFLSYYQSARDLNVSADNKSQAGGKKKDRGDENFTRYFINQGSRDRLAPANLIGLINEASRNRNIEIGKIDILKSFSFFEIEAGWESKLPDAIKQINPSLSVEVAEKPKGDSANRSNSGKRKNARGGSFKRSDSRPSSNNFKGGGRGRRNTRY